MTGCFQPSLAVVQALGRSLITAAMEGAAGELDWEQPNHCLSGFLAGAGEFEATVSTSPDVRCPCCAAAADEDGGNCTILAMLASTGSAIGFWARGTEDSLPRAFASLGDLGLTADPALEALHGLARQGKLLYSARVSMATARPASAGLTPCLHVITFQVHLGLSFFDRKLSARSPDSARWLRRLLCRFTEHSSVQTRGAAEQREIECMHKAALCLGLTSSDGKVAGSTEGLRAFLDLPVPNGAQAQCLRGKFCLEHVLQSILQPSSSSPQAGRDENKSDLPFSEQHKSMQGGGSRVKVCAGAIDETDRFDRKGKRAASPMRHEPSTRGMPVHTLPEETVVQMLELLEPLQLDAISLVCKSMHTAARFCVPGLKLQLYKHQRRAMEWMISRERRPKRVWNAAVARFTSTEGTEYFVSDKVGGAYLTWGNETVSEVDDVRGGLLCDEPGMVRVITLHKCAGHCKHSKCILHMCVCIYAHTKRTHTHTHTHICMCMPTHLMRNICKHQNRARQLR